MNVNVFLICMILVVLYMFLCFSYSKKANAALVSLATTAVETYSGFGVKGESPYMTDFGNYIPTHDVGKTFVNTTGINSARVYTPEYHGQVDRYSVRMLQNDPSVLVSKAKHESGVLQEPFAIKAVPSVPQVADAPVTASTWLEDDSNGSITLKSDCSEVNGVLSCGTK